MKTLKFFTLALAISVWCISCQKDEDTTPPIITITAPAEGAILEKGKTYPVVGTVTDNTELAEIEAAGVKITTFDSPTKHTFANLILLISANEVAGQKVLTFTAKDKAGNTQTKVINITIK